MSETTEIEAEDIRRRYIAVFGGTMDEVRGLKLATLRQLVRGADQQREEYLAMGFEVDEPAA